jgi:hypothetical protein
MDAIGERELDRGERAKRKLMVWCALILFALGIWLLVGPAKARGAEFHSSDEDLSLPSQAATAASWEPWSLGTPGFHPIDEDLSTGTPVVDNVVAVSARISMAAVTAGCR